jgi:crotonobetainyl-CoA:carnitine CoA-transferase CaiB-like acyl-CoA transferase
MASAGVAEQIGVSGGPPAIPNLQIGDLLGGSLTAVMGILAGVVDAQARGIGRYIDVSMTDSLLAHSVLALSTMAGSGRTTPRGEDILLRTPVLRILSNLGRPVPGGGRAGA